MNEKSRNAPLRIYLLILSFSLLFIFVTKAQTKVQTTSPIHTKQGDIIGNVHADNTIQWKEYLGIPYAEPPIDNLRWAPPLPLTSFPQNPLNATKYGKVCMQLNVEGPHMDPVPPPPDDESENCLFLNIFTPMSVNEGEKFAVMVWIYGGAFSWGYSQYYVYNASFIAATERVIVVTFNYRLNAFGFLANPYLNTTLPPLYNPSSSQPNDQLTSGNYGLLDQQLALSWVKENIDLFGGNQSNITLFGWSAGASSTCSHLIMPRSFPYYNQVISESGSCGSPALISDRYSLSQTLAQSLNCSNESSEEMITCLRSKTSVEIIEGCIKGGVTSWYFSVDYVLIPGFPYQLIETGNYNSVPMVMGNNNKEWTWTLEYWTSIYPNVNATWEVVTAVAVHLYGQSAKEILPLYLPPYYSSPYDSFTDLLSDYNYVCPVRQYVLIINNQNNNNNNNNHYKYNNNSGSKPLFYYWFSHEPSWGPREWGAYHQTEMWFVFHQPKLQYRFTKEESLFSFNIMKFWSHFAKFETPSTYVYSINSFENDKLNNKNNNINNYFNNNNNNNNNDNNQIVRESEISRIYFEWPTYDPFDRKYSGLNITLSIGENIRGTQCDQYDTIFPPKTSDNIKSNESHLFSFLVNYFSTFK